MTVATRVMYWSQWLSTPQPCSKAHFKMYTKRVHMKTGLDLSVCLVRSSVHQIVNIRRLSECLWTCLYISAIWKRPVDPHKTKKRERRGDASDRCYGSLVVQEEKPSCKDRVAKWDIAPHGAPETPARKGRLNARF